MIQPDSNMKTSLRAIVATDDDWGIGLNNKLLWHIKADLQRFKQITMGHPVIMGRKTAESLPKPLPGRTNIVLTRNPGWHREGFVNVSSPEDAIAIAGKSEGGDITYVIGGGEIYRLMFPLTEVLEITHIHASAPEVDTFFPEVKMGEWNLEEKSDVQETDDGLAYDFERYVRVQDFSESTVKHNIL